MNTPGHLVLLGSGETSPSGGRVFEKLITAIPQPAVVSILETPAGFELNSPKVAGRVAKYLETRLQNSHPRIHIVPARKKGTTFSPDNADILEPLFCSGAVFMGAGSPTYAVRQLAGSLTWDVVRAKHARGTAVVLASAAIIAAGLKALPVYEVFKVGMDPFWAEGLNLLGAYGLELVFVPHWNNQEGGADLDTSRCFLGEERFNPLLQLLPNGVKVVGLDELTALWIDFSSGSCEVMGQGSLHILEGTNQEDILSGSRFDLSRLGEYRPVEGNLPGVTASVWNDILSRECEKDADSSHLVPGEVIVLVEKRETARREKNWQLADDYRRNIEKAGWQVKDTPAGPLLEALDLD